MVEQYQIINQRVQKDITTIIERDAMLKGEITQLSNSKCDCGNDNTTGWNFPVLCVILFPVLIFLYYMWGYFHFDFLNLITALLDVGAKLNCFWA
ncbi:MAG: hypothetical protein NTZ75_04365 [Euryarchaeota archaeon]|nr:hypothetical protein [Euryarchaeota archaeon]